ncbi:calcineurin subunit B [Citrus sinensis]|uniref:Calcineurin subunit B n=1 Tax=Citrus sinensis TaxID=2711 RepID=A0ACB8P8R0_CITSI|nr:calcineurin subunit B [Citrus sinensis]
MGNASSMLTQYDIEEVQQHCNHAFSQQEIVSLYERFCQLDRNNGGFISAEEFLSVPEFAVNPLSQVLTLIYQCMLVFIFKVYDSDGNGKVTFTDMLDVLRDLTGTFISEKQREQVLTDVLDEAGYTKDSLMILSDFVKILGNSGLKIEVEVPVD